jgi:Zn-dependent protease
MADYIIFFPIVLMSVVFHEYAHGLVAEKLGDPTARQMGRLTLNPLKHIDVFGMFIFPAMLRLLGLPPLGWAKPVPVNFFNLENPKRDMVWVAVAGPLTNFSLAVIASQLSRWIQVPILTEGLLLIMFMNLILAVFNLIPIPPLDGGRVIVGLLPDAWAARYARIEPYGFILVIILLNLGVLNFVSQIVGFLARTLIHGF